VKADTWQRCLVLEPAAAADVSRIWAGRVEKGTSGRGLRWSGRWPRWQAPPWSDCFVIFPVSVSWNWALALLQRSARFAVRLVLGSTVQAMYSLSHLREGNRTHPVQMCGYRPPRSNAAGPG